MLGKIRITTCSKRGVESSKNHVSFYKKYAFIVFNTLSKPLFQKFLHWMLQKERIEKYRVKDVQIRMFPFINANGNGLAGKCNSKGEIRLYPKRRDFCRKQKREFGMENLNLYIKSRAKAALIHELLHLKYVDDEEKVRMLTEKYYNIFTRHQCKQDLHVRNIAEMIFTQ